MPISDLINKVILEDQFTKVFDQYERRLTSVDAKTGQFSNSLGQIAVAGGVVAGGLIAANAALGELTGFAVESQQAMFNVAAAAAAANNEFGDSVGTVESWTGSVQAASDQFRVFGDKDVANATARLVDMTKRLGFSEEQMRTMLARTADLSAGKVELTGGIERVTAAMRGEAESAEYLGLSLNETAVMAYAEAQGQVWKNLSDTEKAQVRYALFLQQTNALQGRAAASAKTMAGKEAELARLREREITQLGQSLLPLREGEIALLQKLANANLNAGNIITTVFGAIQAAYVTFGVVTKTIIDEQIGRLGAFKAAWDALRAGENPVTAFTEALRENSDEAQRLFDVVGNIGGIYRDAFDQVLASNQQAAQAQVELAGVAQDTSGAFQAQGGIAAQVADAIAKEFDKAKASQAQATRQYNRQIADLEYDHAQRIIRIQQDIARATAEAAAEAVAAREAAAANLAAGLAEIEQNLAEAAAEAAAEFHRNLDQLRQDRRDAERQTARDIRQVEEELQQDLADLARDRANQLDSLDSDRADDLADLNQDLADDLADLQYETEQNRLRIIADFADRAVRLEQTYADRRRAINDRFENEFTGADPFRRQMMEFNRREELRLLEEQQAAEQSLLDEQQQQAIGALEEQVRREQEILEREAEQRQAIIDREAEQRRAAIEQQAAERAEALQREADERRAALEQRLAEEIEANRRREEELRRSLAEEQARREQAAVEARAKLQQRHTEEMQQIQEQEARKVQQAQEALAREDQNYQDRLASLRRSNAIEQSEIQQQLAAIENARRQSYTTQINDAEAFMEDLRRIMAGVSGLAQNSASDTLPAGYNSGQSGGNSITVNNYGVQPGYSGAVQTGRSVQDALRGY